MSTRTLGHDGPAVGAIGLGCMGMSEFYGPSEDAVSEQVIHQALDLGVTMLDTADMYGQGHNEQLIGRAVRDRRADVVLATKCGIRREGERRWHDNRPEYIRWACEQSLRRLGVEAIDLLYLHRRDPGVPIEDSVGAMAELVEQGKVRALGLSEVSAATLRAAHRVHPIAAVQTEYSLWTRDVEDDVLPAAQDLGITLVAYSPLGRGFLTGTVTDLGALDDEDFRRGNPRFRRENLRHNLRLVAAVRDLAADLGVTPAQLALAWLLHQDPGIVPIPGTKRLRYLKENIVAAQLTLHPQEIARLEAALPRHSAAGSRYPDAALNALNT
ncbi:aldo/keto reductase [Rathayibacter rathayi]|uniref:aldo/keto reductase n=1 Tax=Rathayibacter rathayi TaxID=33887 RepID=UPI000CE8BEBE|nr:aldo/keto reductase [Rathayibacter rathayi]PPI66457.1 aldo/keto reductase [Rathayibacter rathayi]